MGIFLIIWSSGKTGMFCSTAFPLSSLARSLLSNCARNWESPQLAQV